MATRNIVLALVVAVNCWFGVLSYAKLPDFAYEYCMKVDALPEPDRVNPWKTSHDCFSYLAKNVWYIDVNALKNLSDGLGGKLHSNLQSNSEGFYLGLAALANKTVHEIPLAACVKRAKDGEFRGEFGPNHFVQCLGDVAAPANPSSNLQSFLEEAKLNGESGQDILGDLIRKLGTLGIRCQ
jgi:hypothetical protein